MILAIRREPSGSEQVRRVLSLTVSACLHVIVIGALLLLPPFPTGVPDRKRARSAVRIDILPAQHKVIWLRKNERLPSISPTVQRPDAGKKPDSSKEPDKLFVATNPPNAKHWD